MSFVSVKRVVKFLILGFFLLFGLRLAYGYYRTPATPIRRSSRENVLGSFQQSDAFSGSKKNYASEKIAAVRPSPSAIPAMAVDQKYEKTATVVSSTTNLASDDAAVRAKIEGYRGIVQYEQSSGGGDGAATVHMLIGIQPASFDAFCREIQTVGKLESFSVTKTDKTNEYLNLKAQRNSLESSRAALMDLKNREGRVDEFISLQYRILELDKELQALGVQLGDFDEVNEFCSVRLTLFELRESWIYPPGLLYRLMVAFSWTVKCYAALMFILCGCLAAAFLVVVILERLTRWIDMLKREDRNSEAGNGR